LTTVNRLGELERAIMDVLWDTNSSLTVREVSARLTERNLAHTTVMTVLDRLAKKGFARRECAMGAPGVTAPPLPARPT
jgi:predicted transcriptional regulator